MQLGKVRRPDGTVRIAVRQQDHLHLLQTSATLSAILHADDPVAMIRSLPVTETVAVRAVKVLAPVDNQEVWAAGVTYQRSKVAREEESATSGGARFYDMVYTAARPELFFKAPAWRVVHPGEPVRIRRDATWNVPEPELALVISPKGRIVGYTIGNDMSSRDIEGENPLYLPQAKLYDGACAVGPWVTLAGFLPSPEETTIRVTILREGRPAFEGATAAARMKRTFEELVGWLTKEVTFPDGAILLTGTGVVPPDDFTLAVGDEVAIEIAGIGTLANRVG